MRRVRHESHFVRAGLAILTIRTRHAALINFPDMPRESEARSRNIRDYAREWVALSVAQSRNVCVAPCDFCDGGRNVRRLANGGRPGGERHVHGR
jgi:hypothetical protein